MSSFEETNAQVGLEIARYQAALPGLLADPAIAGRWVVFFQGRVAYIDDDDKRAYDWAVDHLGYYAPFVFARVEPPRVVKVGGAMLTRKDILEPR